MLGMTTIKGGVRVLLTALLPLWCSAAEMSAHYVTSPLAPDSLFVAVDAVPAAGGASVQLRLVDPQQEPALVLPVGPVPRSRRGDRLLLLIDACPRLETDGAILEIEVGGAGGGTLSLPAPVATLRRQDTDLLLLVDDSHSMRKTDPARRRVTAIETFAELAAGHDHVRSLSIASFTYQAKLLLPPTAPAALPPLGSVLAGLKASGRTDMDAGLRLAIRTLQPTAAARKVIVVLSDGKDAPGRYEETHRHCQQLGWSVHTIGLSDLADAETLQRIADQTGGTFHQAATADELEAAFVAAADALARPVLVDEIMLDSEGNDERAPAFELDPFLRSATVSYVGTVGSVLTLTPATEGGRRAPPPRLRGGGVKRLRVAPVPGGWSLELARLGPGRAHGHLQLFGTSEIHLVPFPFEPVDAGRLRVEVLADGAGLATAREVVATLRWPGGVTVVPLSDDGQGVDLEADDGVFGADVPLPYDPLGPIRLELRARFAMAEREGGIRRMVVANIEARRPPLPARTPLPSAVAALQWEGRRIAKAARALVVPSPITAQRVVGASPGMRTAVLAGPDREIPRLAEPIRMAQVESPPEEEPVVVAPLGAPPPPPLRQVVPPAWRVPLALLLLALAIALLVWLLTCRRLNRMVKYLVASTVAHALLLLLTLNLLMETGVVDLAEVAPNIAVKMRALEQELGVELLPPAPPVAVAESMHVAEVARQTVGAGAPHEIPASELAEEAASALRSELEPIEPPSPVEVELAEAEVVSPETPSEATHAVLENESVAAAPHRSEAEVSADMPVAEAPAERVATLQKAVAPARHEQARLDEQAATEASLVQPEARAATAVELAQAEAPLQAKAATADASEWSPEVTTEAVVPLRQAASQVADGPRQAEAPAARVATVQQAAAPARHEQARPEEQAATEVSLVQPMERAATAVKLAEAQAPPQAKAAMSEEREWSPVVTAEAVVLLQQAASPVADGPRQAQVAPATAPSAAATATPRAAARLAEGTANEMPLAAVGPRDLPVVDVAPAVIVRQSSPIAAVHAAVNGELMVAAPHRREGPRQATGPRLAESLQRADVVGSQSAGPVSARVTPAADVTVRTSPLAAAASVARTVEVPELWTNTLASATHRPAALAPPAAQLAPRFAMATPVVVKPAARGAAEGPQRGEEAIRVAASEPAAERLRPEVARPADFLSSSLQATLRPAGQVDRPAMALDRTGSELEIQLGSGTPGGAFKVEISLARYSGDWDCSPTAMLFLGHKLEERTGLAFEISDRVVGFDDPAIMALPFIYMTGHRDFTLSAAELKNLRRYLEGGGHLWIDDSTHFNDATFDRAFRREIAKLLPTRSLQRLDADFRGFKTGYDLSRGYRGYAVPPGDKYRQDYIEGVAINGRIAVVYTRNDYGDGLNIDPNTHPLMTSLTNLSPAEMQEGALRMGINLVLYFLASRNGGADMLQAVARGLDSEESVADVVLPVGVVREVASLAATDLWTVETWGDQAATAKAGGEMRIDFQHGDNEKVAVSHTPDVALTLAEGQSLLMDVENRLSCGIRVALGLSGGEHYFETKPFFLKPGANTAVFDLGESSFKCAASEWDYTADLPTPFSVDRVTVLVYAPRAGGVTVGGLRSVTRE